MKVDSQKLAKAYIKHKGNISKSCRELNISRQTFYRLKNDNEELEQALNEGYEAILHKAEETLQDYIAKGNLTALIFFLKTKGKNRGYNERHEIDQSPRTITISYVKKNRNEK